MKRVLALHPLGLIVADEEGKPLAVKTFPRSAKKIAKIIYSILRGEPPRDLAEFIEDSVGDASEIVLCSPWLRRLAPGGRVDPLDPACRAIRRAMRKLPPRLGVELDDAQYGELLSSIGYHLSGMLVSDALSEPDLLVIRAIDYIDHLNKAMNMLIPAIREWYSIHFPEMNEIVEDHYIYAKIVAEVGARENMTKERLAEIGLKSGEASELAAAAEASIGADLPEEDMKVLRETAGLWVSMYEEREKVEGYVERLMRRVAPNVSAVVNPLVAARLIAIAGSLRRLASMPSSSIQILGAQKAIFMHLTRGTKPPKHGVLFQAREVRTAPKKLRGKIARLLASKIAIAARVDVYGGGRFIGDELRREVDRRLKEILSGR
ncbi:MAG: hypothetical protein DRO06_00120 [Thermoproteota archaeon]|nr:MAG: hypothetical protein DRO06_00120 [Candidatus Korarchaeota archaeon]